MVGDEYLHQNQPDIRGFRGENDEAVGLKPRLRSEFRGTASTGSLFEQNPLATPRAASHKSRTGRVEDMPGRSSPCLESASGI